MDNKRINQGNISFMSQSDFELNNVNNFNLNSYMSVRYLQLKNLLYFLYLLVKYLIAIHKALVMNYL